MFTSTSKTEITLKPLEIQIEISLEIINDKISNRNVIPAKHFQTHKFSMLKNLQKSLPCTTLTSWYPKLTPRFNPAPSG